MKRFIDWVAVAWVVGRLWQIQRRDWTSGSRAFPDEGRPRNEMPFVGLEAVDTGEDSSREGLWIG